MITEIVQQRNWEKQKGTAVLSSSKPRRRIRVPMRNQSTTSNTNLYIMLVQFRLWIPCKHLQNNIQIWQVHAARNMQPWNMQVSTCGPEWPHRQCVGLASRRSHDRGWLSAASLVICSPAGIAVCNTWSSGGTVLCRVGGATSQLDLPSLTPLSVAGCGWLQLGSPHWATSVNYCK